MFTSVFPNPGKERFCIEISGNSRDAFVQVVDMMGREILYRRLEGSTSWMEIRDAAPGIYLFNITLGQIVEQHRILIK